MNPVSIQDDIRIMDVMMEGTPSSGEVVPPSCSPTPAHYDKPIQPWDLERCMESSGNAFVDARRTDAIEYCFRIKGDLLGDLRKARHCIDAAIEVLSASAASGRPEDRP